jgi:hypothetical protein
MRLFKWEWRTCRCGLRVAAPLPAMVGRFEALIQDIVSAKSNLKT